MVSYCLFFFFFHHHRGTWDFHLPSKQWVVYLISVETSLFCFTFSSDLKFGHTSRFHRQVHLWGAHWMEWGPFLLQILLWVNVHLNVEPHKVQLWVNGQDHSVQWFPDIILGMAMQWSFLTGYLKTKFKQHFAQAQIGTIPCGLCSTWSPSLCSQDKVRKTYKFPRNLLYSWPHLSRVETRYKERHRAGQWLRVPFQSQAQWLLHARQLRKWLHFHFYYSPFSPKICLLWKILYVCVWPMCMYVHCVHAWSCP